MKYLLRDDQWKKLYQFLQKEPRAYAGNETETRLFLEAVVWMTRSGAPWRLLPENYGGWNSIYKRFVRWGVSGIWQRMFSQFSKDQDMENILIDSTIVRAHACAAGASKKK